jgi:hypothetical protein
LRVDDRAVGAGDLAVHLPEAPDAGVADLRPRIAGVGLAQHLFGHRRGVVGEIAAGAGDARTVRMRRVHMHGGGGVNEGGAARVLLVVRVAEQVIERLGGIVEGTRPGLDQAGEVGGNQRLGQFDRVRLAVLLGGVFSEGAAEVDDRAVPQHAGALVRTVDDDLHATPPPIAPSLTLPRSRGRGWVGASLPARYRLPRFEPARRGW